MGRNLPSPTEFSDQPDEGEDHGYNPNQVKSHTGDGEGDTENDPQDEKQDGKAEEFAHERQRRPIGREEQTGFWWPPRLVFSVARAWPIFFSCSASLCSCGPTEAGAEICTGTCRVTGAGTEICTGTCHVTEAGVETCIGTCHATGVGAEICTGSCRVTGAGAEICIGTCRVTGAGAEICTGTCCVTGAGVDFFPPRPRFIPATKLDIGLRRFERQMETIPHQHPSIDTPAMNPTALLAE